MSSSTLTTILRQIEERNTQYDDQLDDVMNDYFDGDTQDYQRLCDYINLYPQYREQLMDVSVASVIMDTL